MKPHLQRAADYGTASEAYDFQGYEGKAALVKGFEEDIVVPDLLGLCKWHGDFRRAAMSAKRDAQMYEAGTGEKMTEEVLMLTARRVRALERAYDCREG